MIKSNKIQGFTLLELMITLAIAVIITTIGIPSFTSLIRDSRMTTTINDFLTDLSYARSEAAMRNEEVTVQSNSGVDGEWEAGWDIYVDANNNDTLDAGELLKTQQALENGYTLRANAAIFDTRIVYVATGAMKSNFNGSFLLCFNSDVNTARAIVINAVGRARVDPAPAACS